LKRVCLILALLLCNAIPAAAHGGGDSAYRSVIRQVTPAAGFTVTVVDRDDRLQLTRTGDGEVIVYGYEQEPYLRFAADGVFRNERSPATYLNEDRLGNVALPATADAKAQPEWTKVVAGTTYDWHDHRIHWMGTEPPPAVQRAGDREQKVFDWSVPLAVAGAAGAIDGELDYRPVDGSLWPAIFVGGAVLLLVAALLVTLIRQRLHRTADA
jgi:hypothetical protein